MLNFMINDQSFFSNENLSIINSNYSDDIFPNFESEDFIYFNNDLPEFNIFLQNKRNRTIVENEMNSKNYNQKKKIFL